MDVIKQKERKKKEKVIKMNKIEVFHAFMSKVLLLHHTSHLYVLQKELIYFALR